MLYTRPRFEHNTQDAKNGGKRCQNGLIRMSPVQWKIMQMMRLLYWSRWCLLGAATRWCRYLYQQVTIQPTATNNMRNLSHEHWGFSCSRMSNGLWLWKKETTKTVCNSLIFPKKQILNPKLWTIPFGKQSHAYGKYQPYPTLFGNLIKKNGIYVVLVRCFENVNMFNMFHPFLGSS